VIELAFVLVGFLVGDGVATAVLLNGPDKGYWVVIGVAALNQETTSTFKVRLIIPVFNSKLLVLSNCETTICSINYTCI
jgi:hypothetical protein